MKTRFEQIKDMDINDLTKFMCKFTRAVYELAELDDFDWCEHCPATKFCKLGHTGFEDWLNEAVEINLE